MASSGNLSTGGWHDQPEQQEQQQHDLFGMLGLVLHSLDSTTQHSCLRTLHKASSSGRLCAWSARKHLSLVRYEQGRSKAALMCRLSNKPLPPAAVRAAAAPPIPWGLSTGLQACARLQSLELYASQAQHLLPGGPSAAAAARPTLAATLAGLRSLSVLDIQNAPHLREAGRLVGSCSGLTALELEVTRGVTFTYSTPWLKGLEAAAAGGAARSFVAYQLPGLQNLRAAWPPPGFLESWVASPAASSLTSIQLDGHVPAGADIACLAACRGLQQLQLGGMQDRVKGTPRPPWASKRWQLPLPHQLTQLSALTKLVLEYEQFLRPVPPVVLEMQQLRHLDLLGSWAARGWLPGELSSLQRLTCLQVNGKCVQRMPDRMHMWPQQLQGLGGWPPEVQLGADHVEHVTRCASAFGSNTAMGSVERAVGLRESWSCRGTVLPPGLTQLTALDIGQNNFITGQPANVPNPLPLLRRLCIQAQEPVRLARQLMGAAQHLTHLDLTGYASPYDEDIQVLGVLPALSQLALRAYLLQVGSWLQQQPSLTSLIWEWVTAKQVPDPLPAQLARLRLSGTVDIGDLPVGLSCLTALCELDLRVRPSLHATPATTTQLSAWLSSLQLLEVLGVQEEILAATVSKGVLAQLPHLRQATVHRHSFHPYNRKKGGLPDFDREVAAVFCQAPHLCWAQLSLPVGAPRPY